MEEKTNSLPKDKILDWLKFRVFAHKKVNRTVKLKFVSGKGRKHCEIRRKC